MGDIVVVIPRYQEWLNICEEISLRQCQHILMRYDIVFISPIKMKSIYSNKDKVEFFPNECFESRYAYSELLMSTEFYKRFDTYDYMLIYQLDAYVFKDELQEFCAMGFDYIGAPFDRFSSRRMGGRVGNGGLSLRKIESCMRVTKYKKCIIDEVFRDIPDDGKSMRPEDQFFGWCGYSEKYDFSVADVNTALRFAVERNVRHIYDKVKEGILPFGTHAWSRSFFFFLWKASIANSYGCENTDISDIEKYIYQHERIDYNIFISQKILPYLYKRLLKKEWCNISFDGMLLRDDFYVIWGNGIIGNRIFNILKRCGYNIIGVIDKKNNSISVSTNGEYILYPISYINELSRKGKIIIAVQNATEEISKILTDLGLCRNIDYFLYADVEHIFVLNYIKKFGR